MGAVALAPVRTASYAELAARGAVVRIVAEGLTAERVDLTAPRDTAADLRAALAWRIEAMRAQLVARTRTGLSATLVAVPGLVLPLAPRCTWRGEREQYGRRMWVSLEAQRPLPGRCGSCGEDLPGETGDCLLCAAARVGALRAEGLLGPAAPNGVPVRQSEAAWRAELTAGRVCGRVVDGARDPEDECGPCEMRRASTLSTAKLGGARA